MDLRTFFWIGLMCLPTAYAKAEPTTLEGHYYLHGVMEMGAELLLRKDGTFSGGVEYGSASGIAKGKWYVEDELLSLESDADSQPAKKLAFSFSTETTLQQLERYAQYQNDDFVDLWRKNHVLEMRYARYLQPPIMKPEYVYFEFDQGPGGRLRLSSNEPAYLWIPYDPQRTLKKIGFSTGRNSGPSQWFDVSPVSRLFTINWKKPKNQPISFTQPEENGLAEAQRFLDNDEQNRIKTNYRVSLYHYHPMPPPSIKPVDVYWQFQDGATRQKVWADSNQRDVILPYTGASPLQKIGMRMQGATGDIKWFEVTPDARYVRLEWEAYPDPANGELSLLFQDLQLAIEPNCLAVNFGTGKGCFRR
ncbi:hypothetical protein BK659_03065 [Pseudomonas brassicacearum]|uniref:Uncharacterized protein n=1 Tax=Pseudomonas brassicacearum TaxID=930166 RepID=A0A423HBQ5_9PSED|nr:hypothetical protein [Pseudomonas brassicacearum]RON10507.1 hypothetical protein BK659_03065 [Pseudomonas brassicacearum]